MVTFLRSMMPWCAVLVVGVWLTGCATTPRVDWNSRVGVYSYDQSVIDLGPPDKMAKLSDGGTVAEWMIDRGRYYGSAPAFGYYGAPYGRYGAYPGYLATAEVFDRSPDTYLRLVFDPHGHLASWTDFLR
jgi:hypothetical protein